MTKKDAKQKAPRARARDAKPAGADAAGVNEAQEAHVEEHANVAVTVPDPQPAMVEPEPVGLRTPAIWSHRDRNPRPTGALVKTATLVRGNVYVLSYSTGPITFRKGQAVPITEAEFARLTDAIDVIDFADPSSGHRIRRHIRKFTFADANTGEAIVLEPLPDQECGPGVEFRDIFEEAAAKKKFEGAEFTER